MNVEKRHLVIPELNSESIHSLIEVVVGQVYSENRKAVRNKKGWMINLTWQSQNQKGKK